MRQITESGWQYGTDPIRWHTEHAGEGGFYRELDVDSTNRRRILDREHAHGNTTGPDGWLTMPGHTDHINGVDITDYTRIRWTDHLEEACR